MKRIIALDLGVPRLYTRHDGKYRKALDLEKEIKRLTVLNRAPEMHKTQINKIWKDLHEKRRDWLEQCAKYVFENFDVIFIEDLRIRDMAHSMYNLKDDHKLRNLLMRQSFRLFIKLLEERSYLLNKTLIKVDPRETSQMCSKCGVINKANRRSQSIYRCLCGNNQNADKNAAMNIYRRGMAKYRRV